MTKNLPYVDTCKAHLIDWMDRAIDAGMNRLEMSRLVREAYEREDRRLKQQREIEKLNKQLSKDARR